MTGRPCVQAASAVIAAASILFSTPTPYALRQSAGLTGGTQVSRAYDAIMDARFRDVPALLAATCPPAPAEVCQLLAVISTWWQIQLDPHDRDQDDAFQTSADLVIAALDRQKAHGHTRAGEGVYHSHTMGVMASVML